MTLKVKIDEKALAQQIGKDATEVMQAAVDRLGEAARHRIFTLTSPHLNAEQQKAFNGALKMERGKTSVTLRLEGEEATRMELGFDPYDIKPGLLKGPTAQANKAETGTAYVDVPFEHKTSERGKGTRIPSNMRGAVEAAAQRAKSTKQNQRIFPAGSVPKGSRQEGMVVKPGGKAQTFRRVSENSDPDAWRHPGKAGINAFETASQEIAEMVDDVIEGIVAERKGKT